MKLKITLTFFLLSSLFCSAQLTFQKTYGGSGLDYAYDMHKTSDGGYVLGGINMSVPNTYGDIFVVRTNSSGDTVWTAVYGDTCGQYINDIFQNTDNGFITAGGKFGCGGQTGSGEITRIDANGNVLWAKYCSQNEDPYPVIQDRDGNFIIGGYVSGIGAGAKDAPLMKLDANGDTIWSRTYGGTADDWTYHILQTPDGGYVSSGYTTSFGSGLKDIYLFKTDTDGKLLWSKTYGTAQDESAFGHSVQMTSDGGFILTGSCTNGNQNIFLIKTGSAGNIQWSKAYTGAWAHGVKETADKGFAVVGRSSGVDVVLIKTDSLGNIQWSRTYGGSSSESGWILELADDGGYVLGGWTASFTDGENMYLIKTDPLGNSGCNDAVGTVTSSSYTPTMIIPATQVSVGANTISYPVLYRRGTTVNELCTTVGIEESRDVSETIIFPNPFSNESSIRISSSLKIENAELRIYDLLGNEVRKTSGINSNEIKIEGGDLRSGIYFYQLKNSIENISSGKLIVK